MRWPSWRASALLLTGAVLGATGAWLTPPIWREIVMRTHETSYAALVFRCDNAMREHLIAKQIAIATPSEHTADGLRRAEIGLFDCQDYDIYQKRLMQLGLTENELSLMRLRAIEARADTLHEVVATHEIRY